MPSAIRIIDQAAEIVVDASGFTGNLSGTDTDVQTALGTIDAMSTGGTPGGTTKQIQFNSAGSFGGAAGVEYQAGASPNFLIQAQNAAYVAKVIKLAASQTADGFQVQKSDATVTMGCDSRGVLYSHGGIDPLYSTYIGKGSGNVLATGGFNVCIGNDTGAAITTGIENFMLGYKAGTQLTTGNGNALLGTYAGATLTTATGNTLIGGYAGYKITGAYNVAIGNGAMNNSTGGAAADNAIIGASAMYKITTGAKNVSVGRYAGANITTGAQNIFLGYYGGVYQATSVSNRLIISSQDHGNAANELTNAILVGLMAAAPANQTLAVNAALFLSQVKSGATQAGAGAAAGEVWKTASHASLPDNVLMIGV